MKEMGMGNYQLNQRKACFTNPVLLWETGSMRLKNLLSDYPRSPWMVTRQGKPVFFWIVLYPFIFFASRVLSSLVHVPKIGYTYLVVNTGMHTPPQKKLMWSHSLAQKPGHSVSGEAEFNVRHALLSLYCWAHGEACELTGIHGISSSASGFWPLSPTPICLSFPQCGSWFSDAARRVKGRINWKRRAEKPGHRKR